MTQYPTYVQPQSGGAPAKTSGMAIASLVLGILGFCTGGLLGLIGLVLGIIAIISLSNSANRVGGKGFAIAGISVSACSLLTSCLFIGLLLPALTKARQNAYALKAKYTAQMLGSMQESYATDHADAFPPVNDWVSALSPYAQDIDEMVSWPSDDSGARAYAMNTNLKGEKVSSIQMPQRTVMFFEAESGSQFSGGPELLPHKPRSYNGFLIVFVDGHAENIRPSEVRSLIWQPAPSKPAIPPRSR